MIGITSYGAYIPRLRLDRMAIFQAMGWFAPAIVMVAQGERSMCNHDEDSLTMAVAAARDCLTGKDKRAIDGSLPLFDDAALRRPPERGHPEDRPEPPGRHDHRGLHLVAPRRDDGASHRPRGRAGGKPEEHPRRRRGQTGDETRLLLRDVVRRRRGRPPRGGSGCHRRVQGGLHGLL